MKTFPFDFVPTAKACMFEHMGIFFTRKAQKQRLSNTFRSAKSVIMI